MKTKKTCEINLPYFKQGDDLNHFLQHTDNALDALEQHAQMMDGAAEILRETRKILSSFPGQFEIEADVHFICVYGSNEVVDALVAAKVADIPNWDDEDEDEEDWDEDEYDEEEWDDDEDDNKQESE